MMRRICKVLVASVGVGLGLQQCAPKKTEPEQYVAPPEFRTFLEYNQKRQKEIQQLFKIAPLPLPLLYKEDSAGVGMNFKIEAGRKALGLTKSEIVLRNPYAAKPFPLSYSIIYKNELVTLFEPGYFA